MRYTRYPSRRSSFYDYFPPGMKWLLIVNTAIFLLTSMAPASAAGRYRGSSRWCPTPWCTASTVWQLFTYLFLHGGIWHLLFNMLTLWMFGMQLERDWGTRRFLKYYFICGIGAGLCDVALHASWATGTRAPSALPAPSWECWWPSASVPEPDRADELPVPDQSQVPGDDLCRHRAVVVARAQQRRQHRGAPGRDGGRLPVPQGPPAPFRA